LNDVAVGSAPLRVYVRFCAASQTGFGPLTVPEGRGRGITVRLAVARLVQEFASVKVYVITWTPAPEEGLKKPVEELTPVPEYTPPAGVPPVSAKGAAVIQTEAWADS
jgi:hypothetical protein